MIKILIIDDERDIRDLLKSRISKQFDCWIDLASNVEQGLHMSKNKDYDIIFFDYLFLGDNDGFNFLYDLKRKGRPCVTVMISGYMKTMEDVIEKGLGVAPDEFIPKPFPEGAVIDVMEKYFKSK